MSARGQVAPTREMALLLLLGLLWGVPYALTKISLETIPPITLTVARVLLAAAALWIIVHLLGRPIPRHWSFVGRLFIQGGVACAVPYTFIAFGQQSVDSGLAAILNSSTPLFVCLIAVLGAGHERMTLVRVLGALLGLSGVVLIVGHGAFQGFGEPSLGQLAIVLATFSSAVSVIYGRRFAGVAPEVMAAGTLTCATIVLAPLCFLVEEPWSVTPSSASLLALGANALGATALGFVIYFRLIRTIGSMGTASIGYLKPAVGVLVGCIFLDEALLWTKVVGLVAILIGVAAINGRASLPRWRTMELKSGATGGVILPSARRESISRAVTSG